MDFFGCIRPSQFIWIIVCKSYIYKQTNNDLAKTVLKWEICRKFTSIQMLTDIFFIHTRFLINNDDELPGNFTNWTFFLQVLYLLKFYILRCLQSSSTGDNFNEFSSNDSLSSSVVGKGKLVNHLAWKVKEEY